MGRETRAQLAFLLHPATGEAEHAGRLLAGCQFSDAEHAISAGGVPSDLTSLQAQFSELWSRCVSAAKRERPLLFLVDGLDEMEIKPGEVNIADILPASLAPYVHAVITSRPNPKPLKSVALEHPCRKAEVICLGTFNKKDIAALFQESGDTQGYAAKLSSRVLKVTKGQPLFARFVCHDVVRNGESALDDLEKRPPVGVEQYFQKQLAELDTLVEGKLPWRILGILSVAFGGLTIEELAEVLDEDLREIRTVSDLWRDFF